MVSRAPENVAARRKVVPLANVGGNDAEGDHLASAFGALRDAVRSFRCHSARPTLDPGGHCRRLCRRSIVPGGWRGSCVRGRLRRVGFRAAKRSEEHTSELQSRSDLVCRLLLEKKNNIRG